MSQPKGCLEVNFSGLYTKIPYYYIKFNLNPIFSLLVLGLLFFFFLFVSIIKLIIACSGKKVIAIEPHTIRTFNDRVPVLLIPIILFVFSGSIMGFVLSFIQLFFIVLSYALIIKNHNNVEDIKKYNLLCHSINIVLVVGVAVHLIQLFDQDTNYSKNQCYFYSNN